MPIRELNMIITIKEGVDMTYKEIIINFMKEKNKIIKKHTKMSLLNKADYDELSTWSEYEFSVIAYKLQNTSRGTCPWCMNTRFKCDECGYGRRHGICVYYRSRFCTISTIMAVHALCIPDLPDMQALVNKTRHEIVDKSYQTQGEQI